MTLRQAILPRVCAWLIIALLLWPLVYLAWFGAVSSAVKLDAVPTESGRESPDTNPVGSPNRPAVQPGNTAGVQQPTTSSSSAPDGIDWGAFARSVAVAGVAACAAALIGACLALAVSSKHLPAKPLWGTLLLVPLACPPTVWTLGRLYAFGADGLLAGWLGHGFWPAALQGEFGSHAATALVLAEVHAPLAMLVIARGAAALSQRGWESAKFYLSAWQLPVWLGGALRRELAAAWLLTFLLCLGNFAVPHVLQCRLYPIEIYALLTNYLDPRGAALYALPLLGLGFLVTLLLSISLRSRITDNPRPTPEDTPSASRWSWLAGVGVGLYILLTSGMTIGALLRECGSPALLLKTVREAAPEAGQSLAVGVGSAVVAAIAGWIVANWTSRRRTSVAGVVSLAPLAVPTLIVGLAFSRFFNQPGGATWGDWAWVGDTSLLVILGLGFRAWPFANRIIDSGCRQIPAGSREAAELAGLSGWRRFWWIDLPLQYEFVVTSALLGFVLAVGDVEISQMLCAPGTGTLSLRLFTFLHFGPRHVAAGLALLLMSLSLIPVFIYFLFANRYPRWF